MLQATCCLVYGGLNVTTLFFRILCCQTQFIAYNKVAQFAICKSFSFFVSVYVRPVVVLGSALLKMLLEGIISTSGYLYDLYDSSATI